MDDEVLGSWDEQKVLEMVDAAITQGKALDTQHHNGNTLLHMCAHLGKEGEAFVCIAGVRHG